MTLFSETRPRHRSKSVTRCCVPRLPAQITKPMDLEDQLKLTLSLPYLFRRLTPENSGDEQTFGIRWPQTIHWLYAIVDDIIEVGCSVAWQIVKLLGSGIWYRRPRFMLSTAELKIHSSFLARVSNFLVECYSSYKPDNIFPYSLGPRVPRYQFVLHS